MILLLAPALAGFPLVSAFAEEPPAAPPAEEPAAPAPAAPAPAAPAPPAPSAASTAPGGGETIEVWGDPAVRRARAALDQKLRDEGYRHGERKDDGRTVYRSYTPFEPRVIVHDDGWVYVRREPPRVHSPGKSFTDQGSPAAYLWCVLAPTACVSVGGWMVGPRKYQAMEGRILDAIAPQVRGLNDAVARSALGSRLNRDIPEDLEKIWSLDLPASERRRLLFAYWDSRTETPEGEQARDAIDAFLLGVVQAGPDPFTAEEIAARNAERTVLRPFLPPRGERSPDGNL